MAALTVGRFQQGGRGGRDELDMVTETVELAERLRQGRLSAEEIKEIQRQALERLGAHDPLLRQTLDVKVVCNPRRNFLNLTVRREYVTLCHSDALGGIYFCYFVSDKLEPFVIVTAVDPLQGRLTRLTCRQVDDLVRSRDSFKHKFGVANETYHYTPLSERIESDDFARAGGLAAETKGHSSNWHLKIRVATQMVTHLLPVFALLNITALRTQLEPVRYNFTRETLPWEDVYKQILNDAIP